jgi:hypothetical protein
MPTSIRVILRCRGVCRLIAGDEVPWQRDLVKNIVRASSEFHYDKATGSLISVAVVI